ncbi:MAG: TonB-dependent receptor, partial [Bacteroidales bacterium]|nr:TonB-dependent receptor [Bacteroidales bacterium]
SNFQYSANAYFMNYSNQLVLTGEINDVGAPIRENVGESIRYGLELSGGYQVNKYINLLANFSYNVSSTDYTTVENDELITYDNVTLSFSPKLISGHELVVTPLKYMELALGGKYVSRTYLDNTENEDRSLDGYYTNSLRMGINLAPKNFMKELKLSLLINNLTNVEYSSNGYMWGETVYYYPQAGINYLVGLNLLF